MKIKLAPTHESGLYDNGELRYNIQMALASDGVWYQRHIWYKDQLGEHNPPCVEDWIHGLGPNARMTVIVRDDRIRRAMTELTEEEGER